MSKQYHNYKDLEKAIEKVITKSSSDGTAPIIPRTFASMSDFEANGGCSTYGIGRVWIGNNLYYSNGISLSNKAVSFATLEEFEAAGGAAANPGPSWIGGNLKYYKSTSEQNTYGVSDPFVESALAAAIAGTGFLDFALISDSNGLFNSSTDGGWEIGICKAMQAAGSDMYATPMESVNCNYGSGMSYAGYISIASTLLGGMSGAPTDLDESFLDSLIHAYGYSASGALTATDKNIFLFNPTLIGGSSEDWVYRQYRGSFAAGGGAIGLSARLGYSPYTTLASLSATSVSGTNPAVDVETYDEIAMTLPGVTGGIEVRNIAATTTGQQFFGYSYAYRSTLTGGFSSSILSASGGWGLVNGGTTGAAGSISRHLKNKSPEKLANWFQKIRERQTWYGVDPKVILVINEGMNDRAYTSVHDYKAELKSLVSYLRSIYAMVGEPEAELGFILMPSHRISDTEGTDNQANLTAYSTAADEIAITETNCASFNLNNLMTESEALAAGGTYGWYSSADHYHLLIAGNTELFSRGIHQVLGL